MASSIFTPRFTYEYLNEGQLTADVIINENLNRGDILNNATFTSHSVAAEPGAPTDGDTYIIATSATGTDWEGHDDDVAYYKSGWYFVTPYEGMRGWILSLTPDTLVVYDGTNWKRWDGAAWVTAF